MTRLIVYCKRTADILTAMAWRTSPCSVIKTRMQSLQARIQYKNSFHCAYRIFTEEGVARFWKGTTPRLARLIVSDNPATGLPT